MIGTACNSFSVHGVASTAAIAKADATGCVVTTQHTADNLQANSPHMTVVGQHLNYTTPERCST